MHILCHALSALFINRVVSFDDWSTVNLREICALRSWHGQYSKFPN